MSITHNIHVAYYIIYEYSYLDFFPPLFSGCTLYMLDVVGCILKYILE